MNLKIIINQNNHLLEITFLFIYDFRVANIILWAIIAKSASLAITETRLLEIHLIVSSVLVHYQYPQISKIICLYVPCADVMGEKREKDSLIPQTPPIHYYIFINK